MACGRSEPSVCSDSDIDVIKAEIAELKAKIRIMDGEQRVYIMQSQDRIRKQRCEIEYLQAKQVELQSSLRVCESRTHRQRDVDAIQNLLTALEHTDEIDKLLETERLTLEQLDKEVLSAERRLLSKRKVEGTRGYNQRLTPKTAQILENDLNRVMIQFDTHLTQNSKLREDMESLRIRRITFQQIRQRMEEELEEVRGNIRGVVNRCTEVHNARVEVQLTMMRMKEMAIKDVAYYNIEMTEMEMMMAQERHFQDFLIIKCHDRSGQEDHIHHPLVLDEPEIREEMSEEMLATLDEVFLKIHSLTGEDDLDVLVRRFIQNEEQNLALLNCVNEQNEEAKTLNHQISQTQQDTEQFHENTERENTEHHVLMQDLQEQREANEKMALANKTKATTVTKILDQVRTGMGRVLRRLERQRNMMKDLPSSSGVTNLNLLDVLALMDEKINKLLSIKAFLNSKIPVKVDPKAAACIPKEDPSAKSPTASSGKEVKVKKRPLTQKELRQQMIREILQREGVIWPGRETVVKTSSSQPRPEA